MGKPTFEQAMSQEPRAGDVLRFEQRQFGQFWGHLEWRWREDGTVECRQGRFDLRGGESWEEWHLLFWEKPAKAWADRLREGSSRAEGAHGHCTLVRAT